MINVMDEESIKNLDDNLRYTANFLFVTNFPNPIERLQ